MRLRRRLGLARGGVDTLLLLGTARLLFPFATTVLAAQAPAVNVDLKASWNSAPFLVELL